MMKRMWMISTAAALLCFQPGCSSTVPKGELARGDVNAAKLQRVLQGEAVYVRYLGAGGALIHFGDRTFMTAPYFSGYSLLKVIGSSAIFGAVSPLRVNPRMLDQNAAALEQAALDTSAASVEAIFVGHGHYDHLLDVPRFVRCHAPQAVVYGSATVGELMAQESSRIRSNEVPVCGADAGAERMKDPHFSAAFEPVEDRLSMELPNPNDSRFRVVAIPLRSEHAPHLFGVDALEVCNCLQFCYQHRPARTTCDWRVGRTHAYVFELYDGSELKFRLYHNDAGASPEKTNHAGLKDYAGNIAVEKIDIAILTLASYSEVDPYPDAFLKLARPDHLILSHWEDFFQEYDVSRPAEDYRDGVPASRVQPFVERMRGVKGMSTYLPDIGAEFVLN